jgi:hypothetical protein
MLVFVIPVKSQAVASSWEQVSVLLDRSLRSIGSQTSQNFRVLVVCHEKPETQFDHPNIQYIQVDFPPPYFDQEKQQHNSQTIPSPKKRTLLNADKAKKILIGLEYAHPFSPTHTMVVDADDCVHRRLVEFVEQQPQANGWVLTRGYMYQEGSFWLLQNTQNFHQICGSSVIIRYPLYPLLFPNPDFYDHNIAADLPDLMLQPLPFIGVVYSMTNGENIFMKTARQSQMVKQFRQSGIQIMLQKILKYKVSFLGSKIREDFGLFPVELNTSNDNLTYRGKLNKSGLVESGSVEDD